MTNLHPLARRRQSDEWLTPQSIVAALGPFDLDPCAADGWLTEIPQRYTIADNGWLREWTGRVWLNPPYSEAGKWVTRLARHGSGTALIFARTETNWWFDGIWTKASALLFIRGRISFASRENWKGHNATAPSVLVAYGEKDADLLRSCKIGGAFVDLRRSRSPERPPVDQHEEG